tara:strand:- start:481 stop:1041 length:561 start_codon:yes stop_codon:yes gene_type:complete
MALKIVATALPIEFSEVCEVVFQDLAGTNGRTLSGCFSQAITQGGIFNTTYSGTKDRLSNFRGYDADPDVEIVIGTIVNSKEKYVRVNNLSGTSQTYSIRYTLTAVSFNSGGTVANVTFGGTGTLRFLNDTETITGSVTSFYEQQVLLNLPAAGDTCTVRVEILSLGTDTVPTPAFVDINLSRAAQ